VSCPHKKGCALFPIFTLTTTLKMWQIRYCDGDYDKCERYLRSTRGEAVADNLLPNGKLLAGLPRKET
jgi:hypothetical protein